MQEFLKEWGPAVITAIAVLAIVAIVSTLKTTLSGNFSTLLSKVTSSTDKVIGDSIKEEPTT